VINLSWENNIRLNFNSNDKIFKVRRLLLEGLDRFFCNSNIDTTRFTLFILRKLRNQDGKKSTVLRHFFTRALPFDPLRDHYPEPISIGLLVAMKDIDLLPYSLIACLQSTSNQIIKVTIVCPGEIESIARKKMQFLSNFPNIKFDFLSDEFILNEVGLSDIGFYNSVAKMETLKISLGYLSETKILIIDADTLLLRQRNWCSKSAQISPIAQEYFVGHNIFVKKLICDLNWSGLGFVTHHALFNPVEVKKMVDLTGGIRNVAVSIDQGVELGWNETSGFPSEWQLYGEFLFTYSDSFKLVPASFINIGIPRSILPINENCSYQECLEMIQKIKSIVPSLGSLSLHAYK
jgi:hypothetical protein